MSLLIQPLNYHHDSAQLFERIAHQSWAMLLDSGQMHNVSTNKPGSQYGRYDIMVAEPFITLVTTGDKTEITQQSQVLVSNEDPFDCLNKILSQYKAAPSEFPLPSAVSAISAFASSSPVSL